MCDYELNNFQAHGMAHMHHTLGFDPKTVIVWTSAGISLASETLRQGDPLPPAVLSLMCNTIAGIPKKERVPRY